MSLRPIDRPAATVQPATARTTGTAAAPAARPANSLQHDVFDPSKDRLALLRQTLGRPSAPSPVPVSAKTGGTEKPVEPPANKEEALEAIDDLLIGDPVNRDPDGPGNGQGTVTEDPHDVNDPADRDGKRAKQAEKLVEANAELEAQELEQLTPEQRAQYEQVKAGLEDDPVAQLALQKLLFEGKLPGAEDLEGGGTLLDNLAQLASDDTPLAEGIDRGELLADVVQEVAVPSATAQGYKGTCAATSVVIHLQRENPAEYVRLMTGLASPSGEVRLANGDTIRREDGTIADDGSTRSLSQRLIEPAFMEYANGDLDYRNAENGSFDAEGKKVQEGLYSDEVDHLLEGVFDRKFDNTDGIDTEGEREDAWEELKEEVEGEGRDVEVGLRWGTGGHKVLVTDISEGPDGQEYVTFINPWGKTETMPKEEFLSRLKNMNTESDGLFSGWELPELPKIDLPRIDLPKLDLPFDLGRAVSVARRGPIAA